MDNQKTTEQSSGQSAAVTEIPNTTAPSVQPPVSQAKHGGGGLGTLLLGLLVIISIVGAGAGGYMVRNNKAKQELSDLGSLRGKIAELQKDTYTLPAGAVKVTDCIPNMGAHYITKDADPEYGPFYLVAKNSQVIGIEYMAAADMFTKIPNSPIPLEILGKKSPAFKMKFDHVEFSHLAKGHEGLLRDHTDVHMFTVPAEQVKDACSKT